MVGVEVADADELDLVGRELELRELVDHAHLGRDGTGAHRMAGVPKHVIVAVLDQVAREDERNFHSVVSIGVGKAQRDIDRRRAGATVQTRERNLRR